MDKELLQFIDTFVRAIRDNNAAIFAGAGLSIPVGFVNWKDLLREIAAELKLDVDREHDLIAVAQYHYNEKGNNRHKLNQLLIDEFTQGASVTENHKILASLPIGLYWTTNYDKLIEKALDEEGKTVDVKITQQNLSTNKSRRDAVIYKMHGDVSLPDQAVLTKDDYEGYNEKRALFTTTLQGDLVSKTFLFIGFSFDDPNLEYILSRIRILLGQNQRDHYCFLKKVSPLDFDSEAEFQYAEIKQQLKIRDLRRYSINALLVDSYADITKILRIIKMKVFRSILFISGAAENYAPNVEQDCLDFVHKLSYALASKGFKIVSGFGDGIGGAVINGTAEYVFSTKYRHLDNWLILRPFPRLATGNKTMDERYFEYRHEMISHAGIAIFLFGNKDDGKGGIELSDGMIQEFDIAISWGAIPLPIGATGYASRVLWETVMSEPNKFYPQNRDLLETISSLGDETLPFDKLISLVQKAVGILQNHF